MLVSSAVTLTIGQELVLLGIIVLGMLAAGLVVIYGRGQLGGSDTDQAPSLIRSWIAVALVMGLLVFCAGALYLPDATTRSTMFGGLIASVGAAVASLLLLAGEPTRHARTCSTPRSRCPRAAGADRLHGQGAAARHRRHEVLVHGRRQWRADAELHG